jgi:hypothetical protein
MRRRIQFTPSFLVPSGRFPPVRRFFFLKLNRMAVIQRARSPLGLPQCGHFLTPWTIPRPQRIQGLK